MNQPISSALLLISLLLALPSPAAADATRPSDRYSLRLEARPSAVFPFLDKLGRVQIAVFPQGVRADSLWLGGYLMAGSETVRVENPALRVYTDATYGALRKLFSGLGPEQEPMKLGELEVRKTGRKGTIKNLPVQCYRIVLGKKAWIDVWTTEAIQRSRPYQDLQTQVLMTVSPDLARAARKIPGTVLHVVLNTNDHPETTLLSTREVYRSSAGHEEVLRTGRFFLRVPSLDRLVR